MREFAESFYKSNGMVHWLAAENEFTIDVAAVDDVDLLEKIIENV